MNQTTHLASIVYGARDAIFSKTLDGLITSWNLGAQRMYGYTPEEVLGKHVSMLAPRDRQDEVDTLMGRLNRGETVDHFLTKRQRKDGSIFDCSIVISPVRDIHGVIVGAATIARDVSHLVEAQRIQDRRKLWAYVFIVAVGFFGFLQTQYTQRRSHYETCVAINQNRQVLRTLIDDQVAVADGTQPPPGSDPALVAAFRQSAEQAHKFQAFADSHLPIEHCTRPSFWP